jgi:hypothetical protein
MLFEIPATQIKDEARNLLSSNHHHHDRCTEERNHPSSLDLSCQDYLDPKKQKELVCVINPSWPSYAGGAG